MTALLSFLSPSLSLSLARFLLFYYAVLLCTHIIGKEKRKQRASERKREDEEKWENTIFIIFSYIDSNGYGFPSLSLFVDSKKIWFILGFCWYICPNTSILIETNTVTLSLSLSFFPFFSLIFNQYSKRVTLIRRRNHEKCDRSSRGRKKTLN